MPVEFLTERASAPYALPSAAPLRRNGRILLIAEILKEVLRRDPLDHWASYELARRQTGQDFSRFLAQCRNDGQTILDLAFNYVDAGLFRRSIELLELHKASPVAEMATPNPAASTIMTEFVLAWLNSRIGQTRLSAAWLRRAQQADPSFLFPCRALERRYRNGRCPNPARAVMPPMVLVTSTMIAGDTRTPSEFGKWDYKMIRFLHRCIAT